MADIIDLIEQGKLRRYFRARNKHCFEGAVSHITQHASGKEPLFLEGADYLYILHLMKEFLYEFKFRVLSFVLMPNHIHLLLKFLEPNMPDAMKALLQRYAMYFNKKYQRRGHVFCGAYRSALCFDDSYLLAASLYMHLNPVRSKLVEKPIDYRWSSCALFLNEVKKETFVDYKFVLETLDNNISVARIKYKNLLNQSNVSQINDAFEKREALTIMARMLRERDKEWAEEHGLSGDKDLREKIEELKNKGSLKGPKEKDARKFLIEQLKVRGFAITEISEKLSLSRQSVYSYLRT
ncbi:MAG: transposase [Candidatus Omnitrophica bacterium]|nr:transposase [Candidatus Omnitrophota bacterium]